ncbi:sensor domain-containing protein [Halorhabdus sp. SVX81]|uniref:sensor domain-containing protein n=1 Tax=Halorhabdus sp. SVX81 TaxID=2978283 RepID=UPI0023DB7C76|nr:sensor domain-containing protein [Halorhabdus sp. SVX81]
MSAFDIRSPSVSDDGLGIVLHPGPYKRLVYHVLGFPLGILSFLGVVIGVSLGLTLSILFVGIAILAGTVVLLRVFAIVEARLAATFLDETIQSPRQLDTSPSEPISHVRNACTDEQTWRACAFALVRLPVGVIQFTVAVTLTALSLALVTAPLHYDGVQLFQFGPWWHLGSLSEALLAVPVGVLLWAFSLHVFDLLGTAMERFTRTLLTPVE